MKGTLLENLADGAIAQLYVTKVSTISLHLTKLYVTQSFAIASSVTYSEICKCFSNSEKKVHHLRHYIIRVRAVLYCVFCTFCIKFFSSAPYNIISYVFCVCYNVFNIVLYSIFKYYFALYCVLLYYTVLLYLCCSVLPFSMRNIFYC